jgi:hypothetical protein
MVWGLIALAIVVAIMLAGRAHSRYLDREDKLWADFIASGQADIVASHQADTSGHDTTNRLLPRLWPVANGGPAFPDTP